MSAIYFASIIVSVGLYYTGGSAPNPQRTKAFCVARSSLMQVELEGHRQHVLQLYPDQIMDVLGRSGSTSLSDIQVVQS